MIFNLNYYLNTKDIIFYKFMNNNLVLNMLITKIYICNTPNTIAMTNLNNFFP